MAHPALPQSSHASRFDQANQEENKLKEYEKHQPPTFVSSFLATPRKLGMWLLTATDGTVYLAMVAACEVTHNPWGTALFSALFFLLAGLVSIQVTAGSVYSVVMACKIKRQADAGSLETAIVYWCFATATWPVTFFLLILPSIGPSV
jgi:hypothetical protein